MRIKNALHCTYVWGTGSVIANRSKALRVRGRDHAPETSKGQLEKQQQNFGITFFC